MLHCSTLIFEFSLLLMTERKKGGRAVEVEGLGVLVSVCLRGSVGVNVYLEEDNYYKGSLCIKVVICSHVLK